MPSGLAGSRRRASPPGERTPQLSVEDAGRLIDQVIEHLVEVRQPLVLVSQLQRSGGTLLSQLFDGHPELHAHPYEIHIGHPDKEDWPGLSLDSTPKQQFAVLAERSHRRLFSEGYRKQSLEQAQKDGELFPFLQPPTLTAALYRRLVPENPQTRRELLDGYFTAYFNSWLDNRHLRDGPKQWVTGFAPRLGWGNSRARFVDDYPDGRLIAILRDPYDWYASARAHLQREHGSPYADCEESMTHWVQGAREMVAAHRERPEATLILRFEDLVLQTATVMGAVADWLGIDNAESLISPTFNDLPIRANSSFELKDTGVVQKVVGRGKRLPKADRAVVGRLSREPYEEAAELALRPG
jgi:Sulfotransferase family